MRLGTTTLSVTQPGRRRRISAVAGGGGSGGSGSGGGSGGSGGGSSGVVTDSLALHVDAGDTNSYSGTGTTWSDLTSNSNDLFLINGPTYSSTDGGIFDFDGATDYASTSGGSTVTINASQDFSFDAWIKVDTAGINSLFNIGDYYYSTGLVLYTDTSTNLAMWNGNSLVFSAGSSGYVPTNTWKHVALSRSGSTVTVYLDGTSVGTFTNSAALSGQVDLAMSKYTNQYSNPMDGKISNARLYIGKALTFAEVNQNYNATKDTFYGVITTSLAAHYDAGDTNSYSGTGTTWSDLTSNSNDLTLTNGPVYSSADGGVIDFDGVDDRASTSNTVSISGDFSFDAWIKYDDTGSNPIFNIGDYYLSTGLSLYKKPNTTTLAAIIGNGIVFSGGTVTQSTWTHVALSRSGSTITVYVNGSSVGTFTSSATLSGQLDLATGKWNGSYSGPFLNGQISNARFYNGKALTSAEVNRNYNALSGRF